MKRKIEDIEFFAETLQKFSKYTFFEIYDELLYEYLVHTRKDLSIDREVSKFKIYVKETKEKYTLDLEDFSNLTDFLNTLEAYPFRVYDDWDTLKTK